MSVVNFGESFGGSSATVGDPVDQKDPASLGLGRPDSVF